MKHSIYRVLLASTIMLVVAGTLFAKYPRRMLMEDHTGAWCGWCVLGNQAAEDLSAKYQDMFIPVALHNGDKMVTQYQQTIGQRVGVTGYPTGTLNRMPVTYSQGTSVTNHPIYWEEICSKYSSAESIVDVDVDWDLNKTTNQLTATIKATFSDPYDGQLAFNLFIMADSLTGSGTGWDQHNYLSGNSSYKDHPYYNLPNLITNYYHMNVLIDMLGGAWGTNGTFPASVKAGDTYEYTFNADLSQYNLIQNIDKVWIVGVVQETGSKYEILNSKAVGKLYPKPKIAVQSEKSNYYLLGQHGNKVQQNSSFTNNSNYDIDVELSVDSENAEIPGDWDVSLSQTDFAVPAGSNFSFDAEITLGDIPGYATIPIKAKVKSTNDYEGSETTINFGVLSDGIFNAVFYFDDGRLQPMKEVLSGDEHSTAYIPFNAQTYQAYRTVNFDLITVPESFDSRGVLVNNSDMLSYLLSQLAAGKPILMTSMIDMFFVAGNYSNLMPNQITKDFFHTTWGISGPSQSNPYTIGNQQSGQLYPKEVNGTDVLAGTNVTINQYNQTSHPYYSWWADQIKILNSDIATPIMMYNDNDLPAGNKIAGVKIETAVNRNIYLGFSFDLIMDFNARQKLLTEAIDWLISGVQTEFPDISLDKENLEFGDVKIGGMSTQTVNIANDGAADLTVTSLEFGGLAPDGVFTIEDSPGGEFTLAPGENTDITIGFSPIAEQKYTEVFDVNSNDKNNSTVSVTLSGNGLTSGVKDGVYGVNGVFTVNVGPNPFSERTQIRYNVGGNTAQFVDMYIVDASGKTVSKLVSTLKSPGNYSIEFTGTKLSSGTYYLISKANGVVEHTPIIINR